MPKCPYLAQWVKAQVLFTVVPSPLRHGTAHMCPYAG